jgi:hypothetical protein
MAFAFLLLRRREFWRAACNENMRSVLRRNEKNTIKVQPALTRNKEDV